jgi:antitoxin (DNA-binding transcriptional repressor) of toxin-antitoxin stability system
LRDSLVQVTIHQAQTRLSQLIRKALAGEEIVIAKGKTPLVKLVAIHIGRTARKIGVDKGLVEIAEDFNAPPDDFNLLK